MTFDSLKLPYPSRRSPVYGRAMTASSNPLTSSLGLDVLRSGGNAIDAAVSMAIAMTVLEPTCNGLGSDLFAIVYYQGRLYGINASGPSPKKATYAFYRDRFGQEMPNFGPLTTTVPGAVDGWIQLANRFGRLPWEALFEGPIAYAREGYPVSPVVAKLWALEFEKYQKLDENFDTLYQAFGLDGQAPKPGQVFKNPSLAKTLEKIAKDGRGFFYEGEGARASAAYIQSQGGLLDFDDFASYQASWVDPISISYRGHEIYEMPPNGHGISVLMALGLMERSPSTPSHGEDFLHRQIEATKLSMTLARDYVCDPKFLRRPVEELLSDHFFGLQEKNLGPQSRDFSSYKSEPSTVYLTTADQEGNMVSLIQSNYDGFGSGLVHPDYAISYNNRGANFSLVEGHPNCIGPCKRSYHTIIPGFIMKEGKALGTFGVMGAFMQPQGHVQVISNLLDQGLNPQAALDKPRWQWIGGKNLEVEKDFDPVLVQGLIKRGHQVSDPENSYAMGRGQIILRDDQGIYCGGTEKRTDGHISTY